MCLVRCSGMMMRVDEELEGLYKVDVVMRMQVDVDIF